MEIVLNKIDNNQILDALKVLKKGRYISLSKTKDLGNGISKESDMVIRLGINYANMKVNEGKETKTLPWGHWVKGLENLVIEHKGNYYLRVTSTNPENPESGADIIATRYLKDGKQITKQEAINLIGEKKMQSKASIVYCIKFANILRLGGTSK